MSELPHYSRFSNSESIFWEGEKTFGLYELPERLQNLGPNDLVNYKVESGYAGRPDLISEKYYNTPYYAWVLVMHNKPLNPIGWPKLGSLISVPKNSVLDEAVRG